MTLKLTASLLALSTAAAPAIAQETPVSPASKGDEIIVIGSRIPVTLDEITSSADIITRAEIEARGEAFVADLLRSAAGVSVSQSGGPGGLTQLRLRGAEANQVVVLIDGVEASSPFTGELEFANLQTANIERIEILRGEQSALWGSEAVGGVINIITTDGARDPAASVMAEYGAFDTVRGAASLSGPLGAGTGRLSFSGYETGGIDVSGQGGEKDDFSNTAVSGKVSYPLVENLAVLDFNARYQASAAQSDPDLDFDGVLDNADRVRDSEELFSRAGLSGELDNGVFYEGSGALTLIEAENFAGAASTGASLGRRWDFTLEAGWRGEAFGATHRLIALAESETGMFKNDAGPGTFQNREIGNDALALDYGLTAGPAVFTASVREDFNDRFKDAVTWRVGGAYDFEGLGGRLRASAGEGVTNPGAFELFGYFPGSFIGNPDLKPETSTGWEIGWDQSIEAAGLELSATWFHSELENEIYTVFNPDFTSTVANRDGESTREGVELEARWTPVEALFVTGAATFLDSEESGAEEIRRPGFTASLTAGYRLGERWRVGLSADHVGEQLDTDFSTGTNVTLDAYTLVGAVLGYEFADGWEATVRGENLFDEDYVDVLGYATPGAAAYIGLRWKG